MNIIVSCGDTNGIGLEIFLKAIQKNKYKAKFSIVCNSELLQNYAEMIDIDTKIISDELIIGKKKVKIIESKRNSFIDFGKISLDSANLAKESLEIALKKTLSGEFDAMLTLPISKNALHLCDWDFPGQTEFVASRFENSKPMMILFSEKIKVALATIHIPIQDISEKISEETISKLIIAYEHSLKVDFNIERPKIAVLGLNPHAGENGDIGAEELESIIPAIQKARFNDISVFGPFAADGFFARDRHQEYDGILAMYHDQGLIPMKMLSKSKGVNYTANLPIIRVSPDHGTAYEIAGQKIADEKSCVEAIKWAIKFVQNRRIKTERLS